MRINNNIVGEAAEYVSAYLSSHLDKNFCYHDYFHTFSVVNAVDRLCELSRLSKQEKRILLVSAWFHDTGYTRQIDGHEEAGTSIAEQFLRSKNVDEVETEQVKAYILATKYPQNPKNKLEQIICDADLLYITEPHFIDRSGLLRKEWCATLNRNYTDKEWYELNIEFLRNHTFHTEEYREELNKLKSKNMKRLKTKLEELDLPVKGGIKDKKVTPMSPKKEKPGRLPRLERGVETLFRLTSGNHMKLSGMADDKAHILLSINSIIISVVLSVLVKNLTQLTYLVLPTALLLIVNIASIVFAVLTTKPKISKGIFTAEQIQNREANLLFFGNFHKMEWGSYEWGIKEIMYDKEYLYKSMTKDIYFLGKVLATKYRYLNIGYKIFMFGLIAVVLAFSISFLLAH